MNKKEKAEMILEGLDFVDEIGKNFQAGKQNDGRYIYFDGYC